MKIFSEYLSKADEAKLFERMQASPGGENAARDMAIFSLFLQTGLKLVDVHAIKRDEVIKAVSERAWELVAGRQRLWVRRGLAKHLQVLIAASHDDERLVPFSQSAILQRLAYWTAAAGLTDALSITQLRNTLFVRMFYEVDGARRCLACGAQPGLLKELASSVTKEEYEEMRLSVEREMALGVAA